MFAGQISAYFELPDDSNITGAFVSIVLRLDVQVADDAVFVIAKIKYERLFIHVSHLLAKRRTSNVAGKGYIAPSCRPLFRPVVGAVLKSVSHNLWLKFKFKYKLRVLSDVIFMWQREQCKSAFSTLATSGINSK